MDVVFGLMQTLRDCACRRLHTYFTAMTMTLCKAYFKWCATEIDDALLEVEAQRKVAAPPAIARADLDAARQEARAKAAARRRSST